MKPLLSESRSKGCFFSILLTAISRFLRDKVKMLFKPHFTRFLLTLQWNHMGETALLCISCWLYCYRFKSTQLFILQHGDKLLPQFSLFFLTSLGSIYLFVSLSSSALSIVYVCIVSPCLFLAKRLCATVSAFYYSAETP